MAEITVDSPVPMYRQLAGLIRDRIRSGELARGARVPSEADLCATYSVSRMTVRTALSELEREHLVERIAGKGTFVRHDTRRLERHTRLSGFGENAAGSGLMAGYIALRAGEESVPQNITDHLGIPKPRAFVIERVLLADERPVGTHLSCIPLWILESATPGAFSRETLNHSSLYAAIEEAGGMIDRAEEIVEPAVADAKDAEKLETEEGALLLRVTRTVYDPDDRVLEYVVITYRPDIYTFRQRLSRDGR